MNCHIYYLSVCSFDAFLYVHQLCSMTVSPWNRIEHLTKNMRRRRMDVCVCVRVCEEDRGEDEKPNSENVESSTEDRRHRHVEKLKTKGKLNVIRTEINRQKCAQTKRKPPE